MSFVITNHCPNCGAPIWIQEPPVNPALPPATFFSCGCKPEKNNFVFQVPEVKQDGSGLEVSITCAAEQKKTVLCG